MSSPWRQQVLGIHTILLQGDKGMAPFKFQGDMSALHNLRGDLGSTWTRRRLQSLLETTILKYGLEGDYIVALEEFLGLKNLEDYLCSFTL